MCWCICSDVVQERGGCVRVGVPVAMLYKKEGAVYVLVYL